jgi:hypothetical protein
MAFTVMFFKQKAKFLATKKNSSYFNEQQQLGYAVSHEMCHKRKWNLGLQKK